MPIHGTSWSGRAARGPDGDGSVLRPNSTGSRVTAEGGRSALGEAVQLGLEIDCVERQLAGLVQVLKELRNRQTRFRLGGEGERHVVRVLVDMVDTGWSVLADRRWPGTKRANIDVLLAGPGGVFVIDVKTWRDVRVHDGSLWHGDICADDEVAKLVDQTTAVRTILAEQGLTPAEVVPLMVLAGRRNARVWLGPGQLLAEPVQLLGEYDLSLDLVRRGTRLSSDQVERVISALESDCPAAPAPAAPAPAAPIPSRVPQPQGSASSPALPQTQQTLLDRAQIWQGLVEAAAAEPIENWMTWLHPAQARLITRTWSGPARIRGAAGTGKTVVALHRARYLAGTGRRVLFSSYVHTLAPVFRSLFARLAPDLADRVTFASVHQVAVRLLRSAGTSVNIDQSGLDDCYWRAWAAVRRESPLDAVGVPPSYWREEIAHVIKGRGITDPAEYADLSRVGRRTPLQPAQRAAVWELYTEYERRRVERGLLDWDDVLLLALAAVRTGAVEPDWDAVIVDEVQDLTCVGLQLLHSLVGDAPDGLLIVGDGQQSVYPGGFTLAEAGISVGGRAAVLDLNYRNGADILRHALALLGADPFDDLDPLPAESDRAVQTARPGGCVVRVDAPDDTSQQLAMLTYLEDLHEVDGIRYGDVALLVPTNRAASRWRAVLAQAGVPVMLLAEYDAVPTAAVKVGTFERSKGLDFAHVLIPDADRIPAPRRPRESPDAYAERAELERRRLYVAMVRARDGLWLGTRGGWTP